MILFREYDDLTDTLLHIKIQIQDSIQYAMDNVPRMDTPAELFSWLKKRTTYLSDPTHKDGEPIELLMTMQTMMSGSRTGIPGAGDCDDFTITSLACLIAQGFTDVYVILVGRKYSHPVHIYAAVKDEGTIIPFDLTNQQYGVERNNYKYKQTLKFGI